MIMIDINQKNKNKIKTKNSFKLITNGNNNIIILNRTCLFCREIFSQHKNCRGYSVARSNIAAE